MNKTVAPEEEGKPAGEAGGNAEDPPPPPVPKREKTKAEEKYCECAMVGKVFTFFVLD